jgi:hypothetical protein
VIERVGMRKIWQGLQVWFTGKKTYIGGLAIIAGAVAGAIYKQVTITDAVTLVGAGVAVCGFRANSAQQHSQLVTAVTSVVEAGVEARLGNKAGAAAALAPLKTMAIYEVEQKVEGVAGV